MDNSTAGKGFCKDTEQEKAKRRREKIWKKFLETGNEAELLHHMLEDRPHSETVPGLGTVYSAAKDWKKKD